MLGSDFVDALSNMIDGRIANIRTVIPAKVKDVNYSECSLTAQPLIRRNYNDPSKKVDPPLLYNVPIFVLSADAGGARITFPIKKGDTVLVLFSERSTDGSQGFYESNGSTIVDAFSPVTHGMYPILALPCLYTKKSATPIDPNNVVIENESSKITLKPDGTIDIDGPSSVNITAGSATVNADTVTVDASTVDVTAGTTTVTSATTVAGTLTVTGTLTAAGVTATSLAVSGALTQGGVDIGGTHTHSGVTTGSGTSGPPSP